MAISVVIFLVASGAVASMSIFGSYVNEDDLQVAPGRTVEVYYTGSLYGYYDDEGALIFDTNVSENVENEDYAFVGGFDKSNSFSAMSYIQGKGKLLAMFEDALAGHKAGETVTVEIPLGSGYESEHMVRPDTFTVSKTEYMSLTKFQSLYDVYLPSNGVFPVTFDTVYGWEATAVWDSAKGAVEIVHNPTDGEEYELESNELNVRGTVNLKVTLNGDEIECKIILDIDDDTDDYMLWVKTHYDSYYIYGEADNNRLKVTNKPAAEDTIYFVITIKSVSES